MLWNLGGVCLAASLGPVLALQAFHETKSYSMNRQELIRDASGYSAHCLISEQNNTPQRVMHALFEGNSGGYIEFYPYGLNWNGTGQFYLPLVSPTDTLSNINVLGNNQFSVASEFKLNFDSYALYSVASSVRNIRDWAENTDPMKTNSPFAGKLTVTRDQITLRHTWPPSPKSMSYFVQVDLAPVNKGDATFTNEPVSMANLTNYQTFSVALKNATAGAVMKMTTTTNQPQVVPIDKTAVLKPEFQNDDLAQGLTFLSHEAGWVAGSYRFLTYFGRDTLMTLMMLKDKVTDTMFQTVVTAALARTRLASSESGTLENWVSIYGSDSTGLLCHEDEMGAFPWENATDPRVWRGDFKMLDSNFLVLPLLGYAEQSGKFKVGDYLQKMTKRLLDGSTRTLSDLLEANIKQILAMTQKFADSPVSANLLKIYHSTVGNWRDSNEGLYSGIYPMDVNAAFVPAALQVIADYGDTWFPKKGYGAKAQKSVGVWKSKALDMFKVTVPDKSALEANIGNYVKDATVKGKQGDLTASMKRSTKDELPSEYFISMALLPNGKPVGVLSTDYGLLLAYRDDLPEDVVAEAARAARVKFPRGLVTDAGLVVSNPAYGWLDGVTNQTLVKIMDRTAYHGTVVWSWQHAMYNIGLKNYLSKYPNSGVKEALNALWDVIEGNMDMVESEMWSWQVNAQTGAFKAKDLLEITGSGTEGNVAQLWSYAFIGEARPDSISSSAAPSWATGLGFGSLVLTLVGLVACSA